MSILNSTINSGAMNTIGTTGTYTISSGASGISWQDLTMGTTKITTPLHVNGDAEIEGNLKVGGKDLTKTLEKIEERLNILKVDPQLEERWQELRELGDRYRELEAHILSKERLVRDLMRDYRID